MKRLWTFNGLMLILAIVIWVVANVLGWVLSVNFVSQISCLALALPFLSNILQDKDREKADDVQDD